MDKAMAWMGLVENPTRFVRAVRLVVGPRSTHSLLPKMENIFYFAQYIFFVK